MIHYHGTPMGGKRDDLHRFFRGRHAFVSFARPEDIGVAAETCRSFAIDNGAFSAWRSGAPVMEWGPYYAFVEQWERHPAFAWAIIPDVIDGDEAANDALVDEWPCRHIGVPVWHMHESIERLERLTASYPLVALGSSGEFADIGVSAWWRRMATAMDAICDDGRPRAKLHGLRMLDPAIFHRLPLTSADSTNVARNASRKADECRCSVVAARAIIADRIEAHNSAARWLPLHEAPTLAFMGIEQ